MCCGIKYQMKNTAKIIFVSIAIIASCLNAQTANGAVSEQLVINRAMLASGSDENIRVVAAKQLLVDSNEAARDIIVEILTKADNKQAVAAICTAMNQSCQWDAQVLYCDAYIKPLTGLLGSSDIDIAHWAAQALSVYPYQVIKSDIEAILYNEQAPVDSRLNAIYAVGLKLSEKEAIDAMISLLDDKDISISEQAGKTLQGWAPMGTSKALWNYVRTELKKKSPDEIVRDRLAAQETKVQQLQQQNKTVIDELVAAYELLYLTRSDPAAKSAFLLEAIKKPIAEVRGWAVRNIAVWRNSSDLPVELAAATMEVISDADPSVRLEAAKLMIYMAGANPSDKIMAQLQKEDSEPVQTALLEALSESCYYSLLPSSSIKLDPAVRIYTLNKAAEFLNHNTADRVVVGAEITRKLLEKNGLEDGVVEKYINGVLQRYKQALENNQQLAARILGVLCRFCVNDFHYRAISKKMLEQEFVAALTAVNADTRKAAVTGLINIDKANALRTLRDKQIYNDPDAAVAETVITLAKEVGSSNDYIWLTEKAKHNIDGVWPVIITILQREDVALVEKAINSIDTFAIDDAKKIEMLEIGRKKAGLQYKSTVLLARFYLSRTQTAQAAELYASLLKDAGGISAAVGDGDNAVKALVAGGNFPAVATLIGEMLKAGDIAPQSPLGAFIAEAANADKTGALKAELVKITAQSRQGWIQIVEPWKPAPAAPAPAPAATPAPAPEAASPQPAPAPAPAQAAPAA